MFDKMVFDPSLLIRKLQSSCWKMFTWVKYERPNWQMIAKYSSILGKECLKTNVKDFEIYEIYIYILFSIQLNYQ